MTKPNDQAYEAMYNTFWHRDKTNQSYPTLGGRSADMLSDREDLVALCRSTEEDRLTQFLRTHFAIFFRRRNKYGQAPNVVYVSEKYIGAFVGLFNVLVAATFLFGSIYNLYYVRDPHKRLLLIAAYTTGFAFSIALLTHARRAEVFSACAAYAAVLVVFVSGDFGNGG